MFKFRVDIYDMKKNSFRSFTRCFNTRKEYDSFFNKLWKAQFYNPKRFSFGWIGEENHD